MNFLFDGFYGGLHFRRLAESRFTEKNEGRGRSRGQVIKARKEIIVSLDIKNKHSFWSFAAQPTIQLYFQFCV